MRAGFPARVLCYRVSLLIEILNIQDISSAENDVQFVEHISEGLLDLAGFFSDLVLGPVPFAGVDYLVESVAGLVELVAKGDEIVSCFSHFRGGRCFRFHRIVVICRFRGVFVYLFVSFFVSCMQM